MTGRTRNNLEKTHIFVQNSRTVIYMKLFKQEAGLSVKQSTVVLNAD